MRHTRTAAKEPRREAGRAATARLSLALLAGLAVAACAPAGETQARQEHKINIAHRGASSYAPEHTMHAYLLAIEQGAEYVEQDLQITKDGILVCLHDLTLERTTNVEEVFPDRYREVTRGPNMVREWWVSDFTFEEIKQLDAGSWFDARFAGSKILTFQEAIDAIRGKAGLYPEMKAPETYGERGFDMERLTLKALTENGLDQPGADPKTPVIIQSFSAESLKKMHGELGCRLPLVLLIDEMDRGKWVSIERFREAKAFAAGIGPSKRILEARPEAVRWAHDVGLTVTAYTFRSSNVGKYKDVAEEMSHFLYELGIDAVFTDNPDKFPRRR